MQQVSEMCRKMGRKIDRQARGIIIDFYDREVGRQALTDTPKEN